MTPFAAGATGAAMLIATTAQAHEVGPRGFIDYTGRRIGRLIVLSRAENNKHGTAMWLCRCDCGSMTIKQSGHLGGGACLSCGCLAKELAAERLRNQHRPLKERFFNSIDRSDGCWNWTGSIASNGYGQITDSKHWRRNLHAHRVSYEIHKGMIPHGLVVRHTCDNRRCVNPDHLLVGTHMDNMQDAISRGRMRWQKKPADGRERMRCVIPGGTT